MQLLYATTFLSCYSYDVSVRVLYAPLMSDEFILLSIYLPLPQRRVSQLEFSIKKIMNITGKYGCSGTGRI